MSKINWRRITNKIHETIAILVKFSRAKCILQTLATYEAQHDPSTAIFGQIFLI